MYINNDNIEFLEQKISVDVLKLFKDISDYCEHKICAILIKENTFSFFSDEKYGAGLWDIHGDLAPSAKSSEKRNGQTTCKE